VFRTLTILTTLAVAATTASATTAHRPDARNEFRAEGLTVRFVRPVATPSEPYQIAPDTEVTLDGRPADFAAVPAGATVEYLEVTPDGVIRRVHFRSPPGPPAPRRPR
jgi:hypothetical protein